MDRKFDVHPPPPPVISGITLRPSPGAPTHQGYQTPAKPALRRTQAPRHRTHGRHFDRLDLLGAGGLSGVRDVIDPNVSVPAGRDQPHAIVGERNRAAPVYEGLGGYDIEILERVRYRTVGGGNKRGDEGVSTK